MTQTFKGPLFIIGKPRSGTKLLARILEKHPRIALEVSETQFIPYYLKNKELINELHIKQNFIRFYNSVIKTTYFSQYHTDAIDVDNWYELCTDYSFYNVLEVLLKYYSNQLDNPEAIWGDKSNNYITHVKLLKTNLPTSKFIHIVRDVRDASLSSYNAWRTNIYRYSQRWFNDVNQISNDFDILQPADYIEIKYEELLKHPDIIIKNCLDIIGLEYFDDLLNLNTPSEAVGDAKGLKKIKADNIQKYKQKYSKKTILKIEKITWPLLKKFNYEYEYEGSVKRLSKYVLIYYRFLDVLNRFVFDVKRTGAKNVLSIIKSNLFFIKFKKV